MSEGWKKFIRVLIILVIVFVNFKLISLNKGYINGQPVGGPNLEAENRYINHGAIYNLVGKSKVRTVAVISLLSTVLVTLVYLKDLMKKDKKVLLAFILILLVCVVAINSLTMFIGVPMYV